MPWWAILLALVAASFVALVVWASVLQRREQRKTDEIVRRTDEEWARREEVGRRQEESERRAAERHAREVAAASLRGASGESVEDAARRLGVELRHRTDTEWLGRRGDDAYRAPHAGESGGPAGSRRPVFYMIDPLGRVEVPPGALSAPDSGWKVLEHGTEDKPYHRQLYDGDDFASFTIVSDAIGRRIRIDEGEGWGTWMQRAGHPPGVHVMEWDW